MGCGPQDYAITEGNSYREVKPKELEVGQRANLQGRMT